MSNTASESYKDMFDPGWRAREAARHARFKAAITERKPAAAIVIHNASGQARLVPVLAFNIDPEATL